MIKNVLRVAQLVGVGLAMATSLLAAEPAVIKSSRVMQCECGEKGNEQPTVVTGVSVTPDGRTIAAATDDHCVSIWDASTAQIKAKLEGHADWVHTVVLSADGSTLASGAGDHSLCLWNVEQQKRIFQVPACKKSIAAVCLHPNNQQLAVVGFTNSLAIVNTSSGQTTQELDCPCVDVRTVTFSSNGQLMAAAGRDGRVRIWNVTDGKTLHDIETDGRPIRALAFSPDGAWLAAAGSGPEIRIFDAASGHQLVTLNTRPAKVYALLFTENRQIATGGTDNCIWIWDLNNRQPTAKLVGHTGTVAALACDATGKLLVSGSYDTTLRVWNLYDGPAPTTASRQPAGDAR